VDPFGTVYYYVYTNSGGTNGSPKNGPNFYDLYSLAGSTIAASNEPKWIKNW
jgi:hypothetical protein